MYRKKIIIILVIILSIYLLFANKIMNSLFKYNNVYKYSAIMCSLPDNHIMSSNLVVDFASNDNFMQTTTISGDLREKIEYNNPETATLVLFNNDKAYCIETERVFRQAIIDNKKQNFSGTSFITEISALQVENGIYEFGIIEPHIDNNTLFVYNKLIIKNNHMFKEELKPVIIDVNNINEVDYIDERAVQIDDLGNDVRFIGVVFLKDVDSISSELYIKINDNIYMLPKFRSEWAVQHLGERYAYSHIYTLFPKKRLKTQGSFQYFIKHNEKFYTLGSVYNYKQIQGKYEISQ